MSRYITSRHVRPDGTILWQGKAFRALGRQAGERIALPRGGPDALGFPPVEAVRRSPYRPVE